METSQQFQQGNAPVPSEEKNFPFDERLSSWEMSQLWLIYQANSSIQCILQYFVATAQDPEIKAVLNDALNGITLQLSTVTNLFNTVFPIPHGFSDEDVRPNAKRLYSDSLMLTWLRKIIKFGLVKLSHALPLASRPDVRDYLNNALVFTQSLFNKTQDLLVKKGIAIKPPYIPVPDKVNYVTDKYKYYGGLFGKKRPINVLELTHVFERLETKIAEKAMLLGFVQVVKDKEVKAYFSKGNDVVDKGIDRWSSILKDEDLSPSMHWTSEVTDSIESPFSDRLMLFHVMFSITYSITANGFALGNCNRTDIISSFSKATLDLGVYDKEGLDLMIDKGWLEEIPLAADREEIIGLQ